MAEFSIYERITRGSRKVIYNVDAVAIIAAIIRMGKVVVFTNLG